jgi:methylated-DNA-[protein]-cysteine S-methyltransferase
MKSTDLRFHLCETDLGWVGLAFSPAGLTATTLPRRTRDEALRELMEIGATDPAADAQAAPAAEAVRRLAAGEPADLSLHVDWRGISAFRRAVMEACQRIPPGQTCSYGELAERAGHPRAARAVGRVMATNPFPLIVPCHRVIGSDGGLHGYGGGLDMKAALLRAEGASVRR